MDQPAGSHLPELLRSQQNLHVMALADKNPTIAAFGPLESGVLQSALERVAIFSSSQSCHSVLWRGEVTVEAASKDRTSVAL